MRGVAGVPGSVGATSTAFAIGDGRVARAERATVAFACAAATTAGDELRRAAAGVADETHASTATKTWKSSVSAFERRAIAGA
jgi:hypothetical protein